MPLIFWFLLTFIVGVFIFIRLRLLDLPLESDEGEYAYAGQLILNGIPPYKEIYSMKFPGFTISIHYFFGYLEIVLKQFELVVY